MILASSFLRSSLLSLPWLLCLASVLRWVRFSLVLLLGLMIGFSIKSGSSSLLAATAEISQNYEYAEEVVGEGDKDRVMIAVEESEIYTLSSLDGALTSELSQDEVMYYIGEYLGSEEGDGNGDGDGDITTASTTSVDQNRGPSQLETCAWLGITAGGMVGAVEMADDLVLLTSMQVRNYARSMPKPWTLLMEAGLIAITVVKWSAVVGSICLVTGSAYQLIRAQKIEDSSTHARQ